MCFKKSLLKRIAISLSILFILNIAAVQNSHSSNLASTLEDWMDPDLKGKEKQVADTINIICYEPQTRIPPKVENEDYGYSFRPGTKFDWICLCLIKQKKMKSPTRISFIDLGCGAGHMSALAILAGAKVDAVDFPDTVKLANENIYKNTKDVLGYNAKSAANYYRAFPQSLIAAEAPSWTKTPHELAICKDVIHFFTEPQIQLFAARVFQNLEAEGGFSVQCDTPFLSEASYEFYKSMQGKVLCPGLAIYSKKKRFKGDESKPLRIGSVISKPVPFDDKFGVRPGLIYNGIFNENGKITDKEDYYHNVRNHFMTEDLAAIFVKAGFKAVQQFYLDGEARMIVDGKIPEIGKPSKACVLFVKPSL